MFSILSKLSRFFQEFTKPEKEYRVIVMRDGSVRTNLDNPEVQKDLIRQLEAAKEFALRNNLLSESDLLESEWHKQHSQKINS